MAEPSSAPSKIRLYVVIPGNYLCRPTSADSPKVIEVVLPPTDSVDIAERFISARMHEITLQYRPPSTF